MVNSFVFRVSGDMTTIAPEIQEEEESSGMEDILQVFRIFKLARVLKLARHSPGNCSIWSFIGLVWYLLVFNTNCLSS